MLHTNLVAKRFKVVSVCLVLGVDDPSNCICLYLMIWVVVVLFVWSRLLVPLFRELAGAASCMVKCD